MTTGAPIYLVSACSTGEEFVAAFRRYADRGSVFVPIAEPIPSGRRGRFALTLSTGVVMIEGEGEVISSAKTASVLHGRIGMTIRFGELDDDSKTVLIELEKARLVAKPPAPSIATRTAELPPTPRAVPPTASARVDAAARLAECVAIGDIEQLASATPAKTAGPKFVMPAVLPVGAARPKTPSAPPEMRPKTPTAPPDLRPKIPSAAMPALPRPKAASIPPPMPTLAPLPESKSGPIAAAPKAVPESKSGPIAAAPKPAVPESKSGPIAAKPAVPESKPGPIAAKPLPVVPESKPGPIAAAPPAPPTPKAPAGTASETMPAMPQADREIGGFSATMPAVNIADLKPPAQAPGRVPLHTALANASAEINAPRTSLMEAPPTVQMPVQLPAQIMQAVVPNITPTGMNVVEPPPTTSPGMAAVTPAPGMATPSKDTPLGITVVRPPIETTPTEMAAVPPPPNLTKPMPAVESVAPRAIRDEPTSPSPVRVAAAARREDPTPTPPSRVAPPPTPRRPTPPPMPALEKPRPPVVAEAQILMNSPDLDEKTDLTAVPLIPFTPLPEDRIGRRTVIGVAVTPDGLPVMPAVVAAKTTPDASLDLAAAPVRIATENPFEQVVVQEPEPAPSALAAAAKLPNVEEATPSGDWTITPGADGPTLEPRAPAAPPPEAALQKLVPRLTGDWTIQLDSDSPDGWSEPSRPDIPRAQTPPIVKMEKPRAKSETPPELAARSSSIIVDSVRREDERPFDTEEPSVHVDPTLIGGPIVTDDPPGAPTTTFASPEGPPSGVYPSPVMARIATPIPGTLSSPLAAQRGGLDTMLTTGQMAAVRPPSEAPMPTPAPGYPPIRTTPSPAELAAMVPPTASRGLTDGGVGFFRDSGEIANLGGTGSYATGDSTSLLETRRRRRIIVIAVSAGIVAAIGIVLVIALAGSNGKKSEDPIVNPPADAAPGGSDNRVVVTPDAAVEVAPPDAASVTPAKKECFVDITTVPPGAEVVLGKEIIGTTPAKLPLPCGEEAKLVIRKIRFANQARAVMPTEEGAPLRLTLQKLMFSVKVSSQPAGASITVNGESVAMTPTTMKLPAFELSTITFTKDGFAPETFKVTPKQNNQTVHAQLKRKR